MNKSKKYNLAKCLFIQKSIIYHWQPFFSFLALIFYGKMLSAFCLETPNLR